MTQNDSEENPKPEARKVDIRVLNSKEQEKIDPNASEEANRESGQEEAWKDTAMFSVGSVTLTALTTADKKAGSGTACKDNGGPTDELEDTSEDPAWISEKLLWNQMV